MTSDGYRLMLVTGGMPGATSRLAIVPAEGVVTAVIANGSVDLWPIQRAILRLLLPNFVGDLTANQPVEPDHDRGAFLGVWRGEITTYTGSIPIEIEIRPGGGVSMKMEGKRVSNVPSRGRLEHMGFNDGVYRGLFMGRIPTPDATRSRHVVLIELRRRGGQLIGTASAVAMNQFFCLPYRLELVSAESDGGSAK